MGAAACHPELQEAVIAATQRYGTQFSFSGAYLQSPLYDRLEEALGRMTGGHALVAPSTTIAHLAALPVLVGEDDAVVVDQLAHASLHMALRLLAGIPIRMAAHNDVDRLEREIARLAARHRRVWLVVDGLYSMHGDLAPFADLARLMREHPTLHLYVDDAHSTSWTGVNGRGRALDALPDRSRVIVTLSLNKAFSAAGGALVLPTPELRTLIRQCGGPFIFSGPVQPPLLGAGLASAELHLQPGLGCLQAELTSRIDLVRSLAHGAGVALAADDRTPIFFVPCGPAETTHRLTASLRTRGLYLSPAVYPAVARNRTGLRFTVSLHNTEADIHRLIEELAAAPRSWAA